MSLPPRRLRVALLGAAILAVATPQRAPAQENHLWPSPEIAKEAIGGEPAQLSDGLYRVELSDGYVITTHGPDPAPNKIELLEAGTPQTDPVCSQDHAIHVLYSHPSLVSTNRVDSVKDALRSHIGQMNAVLNQAAAASGGTTANFKVLCDDAGAIRVDSFSNNTIFPYFTNIVESARAAGFNDPDVDYLIFYDGDFPGICGFGQLSNDTRPGAENRNNSGGYGVTYKSCWFSRTPMHENGHTQGAVQTGAPGSDGGGHCTEHNDVMCYPSTSQQCPGAAQYDCGFDSYFDAAPEPGEWLASHWNIGSSANRYIVLGEADQGSPAPSPAPQPEPSASPQPTPSPSPSETPADDPPRRHAMNLTLTLRHHLVAGGRLSAEDGFASCSAPVKVEILKKRQTRWITIATTMTQEGGTFRVRLGDRPGSYAARIAAFTTPETDVCEAATSRPVRHRH
jgi:hypothetical protein